MFKSFVLGRLFGIPIKLHWSYYFILIYAGLKLIENPDQGIVLLIVLAILSISIIAHELAHTLVARKYKIQTYDILLTPIGGMARMTNLPTEPRQEILVASAGPALSILIGLLTLPFLFMTLNQFPDVSSISGVIFQTFVGILSLVSLINLTLGVFNLIPAFPMDGGRILRAILNRKLGIVRATEIAASISKFLALIGFIAGIVLSQFGLIIIAVFIFITSSIELSMVRRREMMKQMQMGGSGMPFNQQFQTDLMNLFRMFGSQMQQRQTQHNQRNTQNDPTNHELDSNSEYIEYKGQQVFMPEKKPDEDN
ncbi:MAG: site-2 protease family protein [Planctomycetes bacterium]|nr:site-2 protease family protein [Planctomycetota bacterium]